MSRKNIKKAAIKHALVELHFQKQRIPSENKNSEVEEKQNRCHETAVKKFASL